MNISQLDVEEQIINIRNTHVILDSDIAALYGVETRDINKAVKNNPDKFPENYIIQLNKREKNELVENFHRFNGLKHSTVNPKATETTLAIIETFTKVREISRTIKTIPKTPQNSPKYQELMQKTGDLISDLVVPDDLDTSETEASIEVNLAIVKFKYSVKKKSK